MDFYPTALSKPKTTQLKLIAVVNFLAQVWDISTEEMHGLILMKLHNLFCTEMSHETRETNE